MLREEDSFCRIGGEEFSIILPHIDKGKAYKGAKKLREAVESHKKILSIKKNFEDDCYCMGERAAYSLQ